MKHEISLTNQAAGHIEIHGAVIDDQTRCTHYHSPLDIIAIRFACCQKYFPCYHCHETYADHEISMWPASQFDTKAILCGVCRHELTINEYLKTSKCPRCDAPFNPGCKTHLAHYFEI